MRTCVRACVRACVAAERDFAGAPIFDMWQLADGFNQHVNETTGTDTDTDTDRRHEQDQVEGSKLLRASQRPINTRMGGDA